MLKREGGRLKGRSQAAAAACAAIAVSVGFAACGDDAEDRTDTSASSARQAEARKAVAPFVNKPSPFPIDQPLRKRPVGAKVAFMDCGTPVCAVLWGLAKQAADTMGLELYRVRTGTSADSVNAAFDSVAEQRPAALLNPSLDPTLWRSALKNLEEADIAIISIGVIDAVSKWGFAADAFGRSATERNGKLLADYIFADHGGDTNVAFYYPPELAFTAPMKAAFEKELERLCPDCEVRSVSAPAATIGNTLPARIIADLQAHPETKTAAFATAEMLAGVPAALGAAGLDVETTGAGGAPANLEMLKSGQQSSDLFIDFPVMVWSMIDLAARAINGDPIPRSSELQPIQFLTKEDITFDPAEGWTGYPDFMERFKKLWGVGAGSDG